MSADWSSVPQPVPYANLGNPQTLNLYSYVNNNPLSQVDADGHFASPWHFLVTFVAAIATGHDPIHAAIWGVKNAGVDFRKGSQSGDAASTHMHAMAALGESSAAAYAGTAQTLSSEEASGEIGAAQHTIQDSYAGGHDYSLWNPSDSGLGKITGGLSLGGFLKHELQDWLPSPSALWGSTKRGDRGNARHRCKPQFDVASRAKSASDTAGSSETPMYRMCSATWLYSCFAAK